MIARISIHRCYKGYRGGAMQGAWMDNFRGTGVRLFRIVDKNFREILFHALR
jgi:hypothetical protein